MFEFKLSLLIFIKIYSHIFLTYYYTIRVSLRLFSLHTNIYYYDILLPYPPNKVKPPFLVYFIPFLKNHNENKEFHHVSRTFPQGHRRQKDTPSQSKPNKHKPRKGFFHHYEKSHNPSFKIEPNLQFTSLDPPVRFPSCRFRPYDIVDSFKEGSPRLLSLWKKS